MLIGNFEGGEFCVLIFFGLFGVNFTAFFTSVAEKKVFFEKVQSE